MFKLTLVVAAILVHIVASQPLPLDVNVEVNVSGVKVPIGQDQSGNQGEPMKKPRAGLLNPYVYLHQDAHKM